MSETFDSLLGNCQISYFKNVKATEPVTVKLRSFLLSDKYKEKVLAVRAIADPKKRSDAKKELSAATISGLFKKRNMRDLETYNGLVCLDFDKKENPEETPETIKGKLAEFDEIAFAATSVGGEGVFAIVATNLDCADEHPKVVALFERIFQRVGLTIDKACKDVCRLRFVSYDPNPVINDTPVLFDAQKYLYQSEQPHEAPKPIIGRFYGSPPPIGETDDAKVERTIRRIEAARVDVTQNYDDWLRLGFALAAAFGSSGESYFCRISAFHPDYDPGKAAKKYAELAKNRRRITLGTFFKICNQHLQFQSA